MPLVVLYGIIRDYNEISFLGRDEEIQLIMEPEHRTALTWILEYCNGRNSLEYIREQVPTVPGPIFDELMTILKQNGIVVDSRELYRGFHKDSANPLLFPRRISPGEIQRLVENRPVVPSSEIRYAMRPSSGTIGRIALRRRSTRAFGPDPLSLEELSSVLRTMYSTGEERTTPSAGSLYPLSIYVQLSRPVEEISEGIYQYDPALGILNRQGEPLTRDQLARALNNEQLDSAPLVIFVAADLERLSHKYGNRGYRYALLEAGHVAQNAYLVCAEKDLGILEYGGFQDELIAEHLKLDYPAQAVMISLLVGKISPFPRATTDPAALAFELHQELVGENKPLEWIRSREMKDGQYRLPKISSGAKYRSPTSAARKMVSERDRFGFGMSCSSDEAMVKAMAEAYERYASGLLRVDAVAPANSLQDEWLDPRVITPLLKSAYKRYHLAPFDPYQMWQWVIGYRFTSGNQIMVPVDHVFYPLHTTQLHRQLCYVSTSSGVAAHVTAEAALKGAMLELIERDAVTTCWYAKRPVTSLPWEYLKPDTRRRAEHWLKQGRKVTFVNVTSDSVPVVLAMIWSENQYPSLVSGACAAMNFQDAASKAWDEAETLLISWRKRRLKKKLAAENIYSPLDHGKLYFPPENLSKVDWLLNAPEATPNTEPEQLDFMVQFDPVVIDLSRPELSRLKVLRVISEKLLPINFGFGNEQYGHRRFQDLGLEWNQDKPSFPHFFA